MTGVDLVQYRKYPGDAWLRADATTADLSAFDFIWASPPCQGFTAYKRRPGHVRPRENLIPVMRERLRASGKPFVIENVAGAPLEEAVMLCGSMFGLDVRRHRFFEANFPIAAEPCRHGEQDARFPGATNRQNLRRTVEVGVYRIPIRTQKSAMGIDWMGLQELSQAIPPAYAEHIGRAALARLHENAP